MRPISYAKAINETLHQIMERDNRIFIIGQGITSPWYVGSTTADLLERFGQKRIIETPVSENGIAGAAIGSALAGMRPVLVHPRMDFMYYAMDQIANHAANWRYMFGGQMRIPLTIWGIINRGGEQAAQHSQALQAMFAHIPGLKVVMPSTPFDAKGLLVSCVESDGPIVYIDDRWLYHYIGDVPEKLYSIPLGKGIIRRKGKDITIAAVSYMAHEALRAAELLHNQEIDAEVIDLRSIKPLDEEILLDSVKKTGRLVIADGGWRSYGIAAEIVSRIAESPLCRELKAPIGRVCLPDVPAPSSSMLEGYYYKKAEDIVHVANKLLEVEYV